MQTDQTQRQTLYASAQQRNETFGYNHQHLPRVQQNYNDNWKCNHLMGETLSQDISEAPQSYYEHSCPDPNVKSIVSSNLYTSLPCHSPDSSIQYIPHVPVEIAPVQRDNYWVADLNARIYERSLLLQPIEDPNMEYHARQSLLTTIAENLRPNSDPYLHTIASTDQSFANQIQHQLPPAVTRY